MTASTGTMTVRTGTRIFPFFHLQAGWNWLNTIEKKNKRPVSALVPWSGLITPVTPPPPLFLDNVLGVMMDQIPKKYFVSTAGHYKLQIMAFEKISSIFSVLFPGGAFLQKRAVVGGNLCIFGEEFGSVARLRAAARQDGFSNPKNCKTHSGEE